MTWLSVTGLLSVPRSFALDQKFDTAGAYYRDQVVKVYIASLGYGVMTKDLSDRAGVSTGLSFSHVYKNIQPASDDQNSLDFKGNDKLEQRSYDFAVDQGILVGTDVGLFYGWLDGQFADSMWYGIRANQWFYDETIKLSLSVRKNKIEQESSDYTDFDGKRIVTPETIEGDNFTASLFSFLSTNTIFMSDYSLTRSSNRPDAWSLGGQIRRYIKALYGSLHLSQIHYENVGTIEPVTEYGTIVADTTSIEWHQKMFRQWILMGGYRFFKEDERPRSNTSNINRTGSDYIYSSLRYRFSKLWTHQSSEVSFLAGRYLSNSSSGGSIYSIGARLIF